MAIWNRGEEVVIQQPASYKKKDGTIYVTNKRVAWSQEGKDELIIAIPFESIRAQAQTPAGNPKIMLRIMLLSSDNAVEVAHTFIFTTPNATANRETIKDAIASSLALVRSVTTPSTPATATPAGIISSPAPSPTSMRGVAPPGGLTKDEIDTRILLLDKSKELRQLHDELVVQNKTVTEIEFWDSPFVKKVRQQLRKDPASKEGQRKGASSKMIDLTRTQEGVDTKYTLTSQIIHDVFLQYPSVKKAYIANVPDKLTEEQFWKRFLASEFFHRSRSGVRNISLKDEIFDRCLQEEDEENQKIPTSLRPEQINKLIDLSATEEDHIDTGNTPDFTMIPGREAQSLPLIRRFNRHAMQVLESSSGSDPNADQASRHSYLDEIILEDLEDHEVPNQIKLDIQDTRRYFETQSGSQSNGVLENGDAQDLIRNYSSKFKRWKPDLTQNLMSKKTGESVLQELNTILKARSVRRLNAKESDTKIPPTVYSKMTAYFSSTNEILRHFWSSNDPYKAEKNQRMVEALRKQQDKYKEVLIVANAEKADMKRVEQMLEPLTKSIVKALETARSRLLKKRLA